MTGGFSDDKWGRRPLMMTALVLLGCLFGALAYFWAALFGVSTVEVVNATGRQLRGASLLLKGVTPLPVPVLAPGESYTVGVSPPGESGLLLLYTLDGAPCSWEGGYIEGSGYHEQLRVTGCGEVGLR